jgi:hypothetical protein
MFWLQKSNRMKMNAAKTKVTRISWQPFTLQVMRDQKQPENVEYFNYLGSMITNDARCTGEIESTIDMAKATFNKCRNLFTNKLDFNLRKKPVKCYIWSIALCGAENWTFREVDQKYIVCFEMWCWRGLEYIYWTDCVRNEETLSRIQEYPTYNKNKKG